MGRGVRDKCCVRMEDGGYLDKSDHVRTVFLLDNLVPGVAIRMGFHDVVVGGLLDLLTVGRGEVGDRHVDVPGECVQAGSDHGEAD
jgi:hypothetical protein